MAAAGTDGLRRTNTAAVLRALRERGPASRALLAQRTGLAKATVGAIVADLHRAGAVTEVDAAPAPSVTGRPGRPVALDGARIAGLGLEVNVGYLAATALDLAGRTVLTHRVPTEAGDELAALRALARRCRDELTGEGRRLMGVEVAVPGLVARERGVVVAAPNLGWDDLDLACDVALALGGQCPVGVDNDANCSAVAEATHGVGAGYDQVLFLTGTVGLGAGLVVDGVVQRGSAGFAGEVGHLPLGGGALRCACGRTGCWETTVGLPAMLRTTGVGGVTGVTGVTGGTGIGAHDPVAAATEVMRLATDDPAVADGVREVGRRLGAGVVALAGLLDPAVVVLGGYFVPLGPLLVPVVEQALQEWLLGAGERRCAVELSTLGLGAASTGAATGALTGVFDGTTALTS